MTSIFYDGQLSDALAKIVMTSESLSPAHYQRCHSQSHWD